MADFIVPNSHSQGRFIESHYKGLRKKLRVITNTIDTLRFVPKKSSESRNEPRVISVGRCAPQKNYLTMIDVVKVLTERGINAHFDWYANTTDELDYPRAVREKIHRLDLDDVITIYKPDANIERRYQSSDVFWLASFYEGFPNVLCEAMACGLPVVCSDVCDNPDIVTPGVNGVLANPESVGQMAAGLEQMLALKGPERERISKNNVERIKELCAEDTFVKKYLELIEK